LSIGLQATSRSWFELVRAAAPEVGCAEQLRAGIVERCHIPLPKHFVDALAEETVAWELGDVIRLSLSDAQCAVLVQLTEAARTVPKTVCVVVTTHFGNGWYIPPPSTTTGRCST